MKIRVLSFLIVLVLLLTGCNSTKFVPEGKYLLDKVKIKTDNKDISKSDLETYLRQTPNAAVFSSVFGGIRMGLGIYNLAGKDSTKKFNKFLKKIGEEPVIYNEALTSISTQQLQMQLQNKGYINATVQNNVTTKGKKASVEYIVKANKPYRIREYEIDLKNSLLNRIAADTSRSQIHTNMLFDVDLLNAERERIANRFRQLGYYNFNKDFLTYLADSTLNSNKVDLKLELRDNFSHSSDSIDKIIFKRFTVRKVIYYANKDINLTTDLQNIGELDTIQFRDFTLVTPKKLILKLDALVQNTYINPNTPYSDRSVERTYSALNTLGPIKFVNISFKEVADTMLDCYIILIPSKAVSFSTELEGTFTQGYWGGAGKINVVDRNMFKGAETFSLQLRGAFEKQEQVWAKELGAQVGLKFPRFMFPFLNYDFKRNLHANTEFSSAFSYQIRPQEFSSTSIGAGIKYFWNRRQYQHVIDLFDLSFINFPYIDPTFKSKYLDTKIYNPFNYENHLIMRTGYSGSFTNYTASRPLQDFSKTSYSIETAGNLLYALDHILKSVPDSNGNYTFFNVRYSQYVKGEYNITHHQIFNSDNRFVYHLGLGVAVPYGNADIIPFEQRFFSGGANSVRGWMESTLGPGTYKKATSANRRDYNQVGDIKLDMNMEYRSKLFWVVEGAMFLDAGNIWTIKPYDNQPGGEFKFDSFLNQIAISYGVGARLDFSYFLIRLDLGVKLFDPSLNRSSQWRVPLTGDDLAFHLAIGYPF